MLSHVDDFLITGTHQFRNSFVSSLKLTFTIGSESRLPLMFTGLAIKKEADGTISVSQEKFVENFVQMDFEPGTHDVLPEREVEAFRSLVGKRQWLSSQTRPDLSFSANTFISCDGMRVDRAKLANKLIRRVIYEKDCKLLFRPLFFTEKPQLRLLKLCIFSDAAFQNLPDGGSQAGYVIGLFSTITEIFHLIGWNSKRVKRIARSTLAAETLALQDAIDNALFLNSIFHKILGVEFDMIAYIDSKQLHDSLKSAKGVTEKRLRVDIAAIREVIDEKGLLIKWLPARFQLADCMTKRTAPTDQLLSVMKSGSLHRKISD